MAPPLLDDPAMALQLAVTNTAPETASVATKQGLPTPLTSTGAEAPVAPAAKRSTRLLPVSATSRRPRPSKARACGPLSAPSTVEAASAAAESCSTQPAPASATKMAPLTSTATPVGLTMFASAAICSMACVAGITRKSHESAVSETSTAPVRASMARPSGPAADTGSDASVVTVIVASAMERSAPRASPT